MTSIPSFLVVGAANTGNSGSEDFAKLTTDKPSHFVFLTEAATPKGKKFDGKNAWINFWQHSIWSDAKAGLQTAIFPKISDNPKEDPGMILKERGLPVKTTTRAFLLVAEYNKATGEMGEVKILACGITLLQQLSNISSDYSENLKGRVFRVSKTGEGLTTKYDAAVIGNKQFDEDELPEINLNLMEKIGPTTFEEIKVYLEGKGYSLDDKPVVTADPEEFEEID